MICKGTIIIPGDRHVKVKDIDEKEEILSKGYYHINCYKERLNQGNVVKEMSKKVMGLLNGVSDKLGIDNEEVVTF